MKRHTSEADFVPQEIVGPKQRRRRLLAALIGLGVGGFLALLIVPGPLPFFMRDRIAHRYARETAVNGREILLGIYAYAEAHGEHFPDARTWEDQVRPYVQVDQKTWETMVAPRTFDGEPVRRLVMNAALSGKSIPALRDPDHTILLYEANDSDRNRADALNSAPPCNARKGSPTFIGFAGGFSTMAPCSTGLQGGRIQAFAQSNRNTARVIAATTARPPLP